MTPPLYLAEIIAYDPALGTTTTLRYSTGRGFVTGPAETPANTFYDPRILQPAVIRRDCFTAGASRGRSRVGYGDLVLLNGDGALDDLLTYGFDGRAITIRRGAEGAAYPSGFTTVLVGTILTAEFTHDRITFKLRDRQAETQVPLQANKYAGDNVLPDGLEGTADDLKGKPKPLCFGVVKNVAAVLVNISKLIYQVNDGAINSLDDVYDRGVRLTGGIRSVAARSGPSGSYAACYSPELGLFVSVGPSTNFHTSPDGITWTSRASGYGSQPFYGVAWDPVIGLFVAVGTSGQLTTSPDGETWTTRTSGFGSSTINDVASDGNGLFVTVGADGKLFTSTDGINWSSQTSSFGATVIYGVTRGRANWVAVGDGGKLATSPDGTTWTQQTSGLSLAIFKVAWSPRNNMFAASGNAEAFLLISDDDGVSWVKRPVTGTPPGGTTPAGFYRVAWMGDVFIASATVDVDGLMAISDSTGRTWEWLPRWVTSGNTFAGLAYGNGMAIFGRSAGTLYSSFGPSFYGSLADLEDDSLAPKAGCWKAYLSGGYFRLGALPAGLITADVTEGATAADRTAAQIWKRALVLAGFTGADYSSDDVTALDAANASILGFWTGAEMPLAELLDACGRSVGAWWGADRLGVFRLQQFTSPNLIENGEYEVDAVGSAAVGGSTLVRSNTHAKHGQYSLKITTANSADSGASFTLRSGSRIPAVVGETSVLLVWVYGTGSAVGKTLRLAIAWYTSGGSLISTATQDGYTLVEGWQALRFSAVAPATTATALPAVLTDSAEGVFDLWIDGVQCAAPVASFDANDLLQPVVRAVAQDPAGGLPVFQTIVRYGRLGVVQASDLAGAVTDDRRAMLAREWREATATDATVQTAHLLSPQVVEDSLLQVEGNAQAEADRRQTLRGVQRDRFELLVAYRDELLSLDLGQVIELTHARYGLDGGKFFRATGVEPNAERRRLSLSVWG
jgi:hypothetical protein